MFQYRILITHQKALRILLFFFFGCCSLVPRMTYSQHGISLGLLLEDSLIRANLFSGELSKR